VVCERALASADLTFLLSSCPPPALAWHLVTSVDKSFIKRSFSNILSIFGNHYIESLGGSGPEATSGCERRDSVKSVGVEKDIFGSSFSFFWFIFNCRRSRFPFGE
jgi:hypothetical protein